MKQKGITLILTLYKPTKSQILYWRETISYLKEKGIDSIVLNDNPTLEVEFPDCKVINNKINKGKFKTVYDFVKTKSINTTHFKVCDPDDKLETAPLLEESNYYKNGTTYVMRKKKINLFGEVSYEEVFSLPNCSTVLDTESIENDIYFKEEMFAKNWIEDQLLGMISYANGAEVKKVSHSWYLYYEETGMTREIGESDIKEIIETLKTFWTIIKENNINIKTSFPGKLSYIEGLIDKSTKVNEEEKKKWINELLNYKEDKYE